MSKNYLLHFLCRSSCEDKLPTKCKPAMSYVIDVQVPATKPAYSKSSPLPLSTLPARGPGLVKKIESPQKDAKSFTLPQSPTAETLTSSPGTDTSHMTPTKPTPYVFASPGTKSGQEGRGGGGEGGGGRGEGVRNEAVLRGAREEVATSGGPGELDT